MSRWKLATISMVLCLTDLTCSFAWLTYVKTVEQPVGLVKADVAAVMMGDIDARLPDIGPETRRRLDYAMTLQRQGLFTTYLCVGGARPAKSFIGAQRMKQYLMRRGVEETSILIEPRSYDTRTNLQYAADIVRVENLRSVIIVSSPLHIHRIRTTPELGSLRGHFLQYAPYAVESATEAKGFMELWLEVHHDWFAYGTRLLPGSYYERMIRFARDQ